MWWKAIFQAIVAYLVTFWESFKKKEVKNSSVRISTEIRPGSERKMYEVLSKKTKSFPCESMLPY